MKLARFGVAVLFAIGYGAAIGWGLSFIDRNLGIAIGVLVAIVVAVISVQATFLRMNPGGASSQGSVLIRAAVAAGTLPAGYTIGRELADPNLGVIAALALAAAVGAPLLLRMQAK